MKGWIKAMDTATNILVVDDNEQNLSLIRTILRRHGFHSRLANNGEEALRQVRHRPPDLIILDVMMPGMDGIEVCRQLKDNDETRLIPIVIMTALDQPEDKIRGIEAGADDFLFKPVNQSELMARVRTALRMKQTVDRKMAVLLHTKEQLCKFVPLAVRQRVEADPEAPDLERRQQDVSILFVDVSGYSKLSQFMEQERVDALVERYFSQFIDCIHEHAGDISETSGDGMMVVFQHEEPGEHAMRAARSALGMLEVTARLNGQWREMEQPVAVHIGIDSGVALVGSSRFEGLRESRWTFTANGTVANLAARLRDAAPPGTILIGSGAAARLTTSFLLEGLGPQTFKNLQAVEVFRLLGEHQEATCCLLEEEPGEKGGDAEKTAKRRQTE
jgi:DNA-binding response OmpR family regulator